MTKMKILESIPCKSIGHKYYVIKEITSETRCVGCSRCNKVWAMNDRVNSLVLWDSDFSKFYDFNK